MNRLFGLETEYGITIDGVNRIDVVEESMQLIRCYLTGDFTPLWDYQLENPRKDVRGFEVSSLLQRYRRESAPSERPPAKSAAR